MSSGTVQIFDPPALDGAQRGAPAADCFPAAPASWYFLCRSRDLRNTPVGTELLGRRLALFRDIDGRPAAIDADCSHMGADLSRGCLKDGRLQCPFHGWEYAADGRCVRIPAQRQIPAFARQRTCRVEERHGLLFAFSREDPLFPLSEFFEPTASPLVPGRPAHYAIDCPWHMLGANGFDLQHFALVHDRELLDEPVIDSPSRFARRIRFTSRVTGTSLGDRLIRRLIGDRVAVSITVWAGNLIAVTAKFRRATSRLVFVTSPLDAHRTSVDLIVLSERGPRWRSWLTPLSLWVRRALTIAFVRSDTERVRRALYRPGTLIEADRAMIEYYRWLGGIPRSFYESCSPNPGTSTCNLAAQTPRREEASLKDTRPLSLPLHGALGPLASDSTSGVGPSGVHGG